MGEKVLSLSYSSTILGPPPCNEELILMDKLKSGFLRWNLLPVQMPTSATSKQGLGREVRAALLRVRTGPEFPKDNLRELT